MAAKVGHDCQVTLGANKVLGIGTWNHSGRAMDVLEDTEFGDDFKSYKGGLLEGGQITFAGYYDPADTTGQEALQGYWEARTEVTSMRLYVDNTSYWTPTTTNPLSAVLITAFEISADKSGLMQISFTAKVSGNTELI